MLSTTEQHSCSTRRLFSTSHALTSSSSQSRRGLPQMSGVLVCVIQSFNMHRTSSWFWQCLDLTDWEQVHNSSRESAGSCEKITTIGNQFIVAWRTDRRSDQAKVKPRQQTRRPCQGGSARVSRALAHATCCDYNMLVTRQPPD